MLNKAAYIPMKLLPAALFLIAATFLDTTVFAQARSVVNGRSKVVETYEIDRDEYVKDPQKAKRWLTHATVHDRSGRVVGRWDFVNDSSGAYYRKYVFDNDRFGRRTTEWVFESSRTSPGKSFSVSYTSRSIKIVPELPETPSMITISKYDSRGNQIEVETSDGEGKVTQRVTQGYDTRQRLISFHNAKGDGTIICISNTTYTADGLTSTQTFGECSNSDILKIVTQIDPKGRPLIEEQYSRVAEGGNEIVLTSRAVRVYSGNVENLDWTIWNNSGLPTTKLLVVAKDDHTVAEKAMIPDPSATEGKSMWKLSREETRDYEFDKDGIVTRELWKQRKSGEAFQPVLIIERSVRYF